MIRWIRARRLEFRTQSCREPTHAYLGYDLYRTLQTHFERSIPVWEMSEEQRKYLMCATNVVIQFEGLHLMEVANDPGHLRVC